MEQFHGGKNRVFYINGLNDLAYRLHMEICYGSVQNINWKNWIYFSLVYSNSSYLNRYSNHHIWLPFPPSVVE